MKDKNRTAREEAAADTQTPPQPPPADGSTAGDVPEALADRASDIDAEDARDPLSTEAPSIASELQEELRELRELRDRHLRLAAEFDNYRRRTRKELVDMRGRAQGELVSELLDALDDLGRVADIPADQTTTEALHEGVDLVERKFRKAFAGLGVEKVAAVGERFDPNLHEALGTIPTDDPDQDDIIAQELVIGYRLGEMLLRPARVIVMQHDDGAPTDLS